MILKKDINEFRQRGWGHSDYFISESQLKDLLNGKLLAIDDVEYTCTIKYLEDENE